MQGKKINQEMVDKIVSAIKAGTPPSIITSKYGVSHTTIERIKHKYNLTHIQAHRYYHKKQKPIEEKKHSLSEPVNCEWQSPTMKSCIYYSSTGGGSCDYIGIMKHRRPCPASECTCYTPCKQRRKPTIPY